MDYTEKDKEFYGIIHKKREEINSMNISKKEKEKLYSIIDETTQRYEKQKKINVGDSVKRLCGYLEIIYITSVNLVNITKHMVKENNNLENKVKILREKGLIQKPTLH